MKQFSADYIQPTIACILKGEELQSKYLHKANNFLLRWYVFVRKVPHNLTQYIRTYMHV